MTGSTNPTEAARDQGFLAPKPGSKPVDHCFRCGKETPPGVGQSEEHNRGHISGPSPAQMHATIFVGIVIGVLALLFLGTLAVTTTGPFPSDVTAAAPGPDGGVALSYIVTNDGEEEGVADCRVTRDGVPRPDDLAFRTPPLPAGETMTFERQLAAPPEGSIRYDLEALTVACT